MKIYFCSVLLLFSIQVKSQKFFTKPAKQGGITFKEMQLQYNDWARTHDLKKEKHWKYFKRWEMDMQLHTNTTGEPSNRDSYINDAVKTAKEKDFIANFKSASSSWYPVGPNALPTNNTGYMENGIGRINCIAFDPTNSSTYYVGVAQGGVWKTTNNGVNWAPLTDNLPIMRISDIAIDPNNTSTMYISVGLIYNYFSNQ